MPSLYQLVSCSRSHVLTARITLSSSSNFVPRSVSFRGLKRWKSDGARSGLQGGWGSTIQPNLAIASWFQSLVWGRALCWSNMSSGFLFRPHSPVMLFQFFEGFDVRVQIDCLTSGNHIHKNVWAGGCGRTPRPRSIMRLRFCTSWSLNSLNPVSNGAPIYCTTSYAAHNRLWMFSTLSFSHH
jgi:hypothetical protein